MAEDAGGNTATGYTGTVHFSSTDAGSPVLPTDATFVGGDNGTRTFTAGFTLKTAGGRTVTATDTVAGSVTGTSGTVTVSAGAAARLAIGTQPSGTATAGTAFAQQPTVRVEDAFGNLVTGDSTTDVTLALTTAGGATLGGATSKTASGGLATFTDLSIDKAGSYTLDATSSPAHAGATSGAIVVDATGADHYLVTSSSYSPAAGSDVTISAQLVDAFDNPVATSGVAADWTLDGIGGSLGVASSLTDGSGITTVAYTTSGVAGTARQVIATTASVTGHSPTITTVARPATKLAVTGFADPATAGVPSPFTVTAQDALGNTVTGYVGTVHVTSTDAAAVLPGDYTFLSADNGSHAVSGTLRTAGTASITATDTVTGSITGSQAGISVSAASAA